jgi:hypothetical protein
MRIIGFLAAFLKLLIVLIRHQLLILQMVPVVKKFFEFGIELTADSVPMSACGHNSYELRRTLEFMRESSNE